METNINDGLVQSGDCPDNTKVEHNCAFCNVVVDRRGCLFVCSPQEDCTSEKNVFHVNNNLSTDVLCTGL